MVDQELDLTARLARAIKNYEASWKSVGNELYDLCRRRPDHDDFADVYTKVAVIGGSMRLEWPVPGARG
jgi:hypothetical protein